MKAFTATKRDNEREVMRLELTGEDVELLEGLVERLEVLAQVEDLLDARAMHSPFITGHDFPHCTRAGAELLRQIVQGWGGDLLPGEVLEVVTELG